MSGFPTKTKRDHLCCCWKRDISEFQYARKSWQFVRISDFFFLRSLGRTSDLKKTKTENGFYTTFGKFVSPGAPSRRSDIVRPKGQKATPPSQHRMACVTTKQWRPPHPTLPLRRRRRDVPCRAWRPLESPAPSPSRPSAGHRYLFPFLQSELQFPQRKEKTRKGSKEASTRDSSKKRNSQSTAAGIPHGMKTLACHMSFMRAYTYRNTRNRGISHSLQMRYECWNNRFHSKKRVLVM